MIIHKNPDGTYKIQPEGWKERFCIKISFQRWKTEGTMIPSFYLPVGTEPITCCTECWIFPIAPFVLFWRITKRAFYCIWRDLVDFAYLLQQHIFMHINQRKHDLRRKREKPLPRAEEDSVF